VDRAVRDKVATAIVRVQQTQQQLVRQILAKTVTFGDRLIEFMLRHAKIVKRFRALQGEIKL